MQLVTNMYFICGLEFRLLKIIREQKSPIIVLRCRMHFLTQFLMCLFTEW
nr:MAG TPA: hypothetical protein [Caudoviricetes sp.]